MTIGAADLTSLRFIKEVTWGTTPGAGNLTQIRYTGESLDANLETVVSKEIRPDRMTADLVPVGQSAGGSFDMEMSFGAFDDFMEGAMFSTFGAALAIVGVAGDIDSDASGFASGTASKFDTIVVGQWFEVRGFAANSGENNGYYKCLTNTGTSMTTSPVPPSAETPAGTDAEMHGQMLRNGIVQQSYSIEKRFEGLDATTFQLFKGSMIAGFTQNYAVGEILTGSVEVLSKEGTMDEIGLTGLTDTAAATGDILNAVNDMQDVRVDNAASASSYLTLTLEIGNNLRGQKAIGTLGNVGVGVGKLDVTGNISVYFEDTSEMDKFNGNTAFSLSFRLQDAAGNAYIYTFPKVKYENLSVTAGGENSDLVAEGSWRALLDSTLSCMVQIDKFSAA